MSLDLAAAREAYARDGVVRLPGVLDAEAMAGALAAYDWSLANPGPGATRFAQTTDSTFYNDLYNPRCLEGYTAMLQASPIPALVAGLCILLTLPHILALWWEAPRGIPYLQSLAWTVLAMDSAADSLSR